VEEDFWGTRKSYDMSCEGMNDKIGQEVVRQIWVCERCWGCFGRLWDCEVVWTDEHEGQRNCFGGES
jgi:hypothetical protein